MIDRPDLTNLDPTVKAYIESLEHELAQYHKESPEEKYLPPLELSEKPTTLNVVTLTNDGYAKRTPRHLYSRQRRGGMGIFDLDIPEDTTPGILVVADESQALLLFTSQARVFRYPLNLLPESPVRAKGQLITDRASINPDEKFVAALPDIAKGGVALLSERGNVRFLRHHVFGEYMKPGTVLFDPLKFGRLVAACRTPGDGDLFIATRQGRAIRFSEKLIPPQGCAGMRLEAGDSVVVIASTNEEGAVFLADGSGKGTIRQMEGFAANKSAGGGGKYAMKTSELISAHAYNEGDEIFMISKLSKIIRFMGEEVPAKEGVVQGVNCMALRADEVVAVTLTR
jgi:DNA gyrase subunit A